MKPIYSERGNSPNSFLVYVSLKMNQLYKKYKGIPTLIIILVWITSSHCIYGQDQSDYEIWKKRNDSSKKSFESADRQNYNKFLEQDWREYSVFKSNKRDTVKKPTQIPILERKEQVKNEINDRFLIKDNLSFVKRSLNKPISKEMVYTLSDPSIQFNYFGYELVLPILNVSRLDISSQINKMAIKRICDSYAISEYKEVMNDLNDVEDKTKVNDWGYLILLDNYSENLFSNENDKLLFMWYILIQRGFDVRVGYNDEKIYLLLPTKLEVYGTLYLSLNGRKYYIYPFINDSGYNSIYTYDEKTYNNNNYINLAFENAPNFINDGFEKILNVKYKNENITVRASSNLNQIRYLNTFPQTELKVYFEYTPDNQFFNSATKSLSGYVIGKSEGESANILLHFVQKAQGYETDAEQFNSENYLFPEETIYYNYSDCEDRAILYAYLVRQLLGLKVVGLDYPGHVATAVKFNGRINGDAITYKGDRYLKCDPTYINADIGQCMPSFKNIKPNIIEY